MNSILLLLNVALVLACSACLLACAGIRSRPAYLIGLYVLSYADVVIVLECAGLFSAIQASVVFALQLCLTALSLLVWIRAGKPSVLGPFAGLKGIRLAFGDLFTEVQKSPLLIALITMLAGSVGYVYVRHAQLILLVPPDNWDSLTYHLSRVGYWLQYKSFYPWPTPNPAQTMYPMNAELGFLWTILWWGTDQLAGFVQWMAVPVIMTGTYGLTILLGYPRRQATITALLWATLTQVLVQSTTTQNDLVAAGFWVSALFLFFAASRERTDVPRFLSGVAVGLAIGTKTTSLMVLPGLALACVAIVTLSRGRKQLQYALMRWMIACLLGTLVFGSYAYIQNVVAFRNPLGPLGSSKYLTQYSFSLNAGDPIGAASARLRDNVARYTYQLWDLSPLPLQLATRLNPIKAAVFSPLFRGLGISLDNPQTIGREAFGLDYINPAAGDNSWFGPLTAFLTTAVLYQVYRGWARADARRLALGITAIGFLVVDSAAQAWTPAAGRYYMIAIAIGLPLIACFLDSAHFGALELRSLSCFSG